MIGYTGATQIPNNNYFANRDGLTPRYVILHGTAGGTDAVALGNYFASTEGTANPVSSTYGIGQNGTIAQYVSEADGAWANGALTTGHASFWNEGINPNNITISIEHCKPSTDNSDALTAAQQDASFKLIHDICQRWQIPLHDADATGGITGHFSIDPVNRSNCPGVYPWDALWAYLKNNSASSEEEIVTIAINTTGVGRYFKQSGSMWQCTEPGHDFIIGNAILAFYQSCGGVDLCGLTFLGLPITNEFSVGKGCTAQLFERGLVIWDPSRVIDNPPGATGQCYLGHLNQGVGLQMISQPVAQALNEQIKNLQAKLAQVPVTPPDVTTLQAQIAQMQTLVGSYQSKFSQIAALAKS